MKTKASLQSRIAATLLVPASAMGLMASGTASAGQCGDPWVTQAVTEVLRRPPPSNNAPECNIKLYNNGHWSNYKELRLAVGTYWSLHSYPSAAAPPVATLAPLTVSAQSVQNMPHATKDGQTVVFFNNRWNYLVASGAGNFQLKPGVVGKIMVNNGANLISQDGGSFKPR